MNLKTFLTEVTNQIRAGAAAAGCIPNPRVEIEISLKPDGSVAMSHDDVCERVHVTMLMLPNGQKLSHREEKP